MCEKNNKELFSKVNKLILNNRFIEAKNILLSVNEDDILDSEKFVYYNFCFNVFIKTANVYHEHSFLEAINFGKKAILNTENLDRKSILSGNIAIYLMQMRKNQLAKDYVESCLDYAKTDNLKCFAFKIQGKLMMNEGLYAEALNCLTKAAYYAEKLNEECMQFHITLDIASVFERMKKYNLAYIEADRAEGYSKSLKDLNLFYRVTIFKAKLLYKLGRDTEVRRIVDNVPDLVD